MQEAADRHANACEAFDLFWQPCARTLLSEEMMSRFKTEFSGRVGRLFSRRYRRDISRFSEFWRGAHQLAYHEMIGANGQLERAERDRESLAAQGESLLGNRFHERQTNWDEVRDDFRAWSRIGPNIREGALEMATSEPRTLPTVTDVFKSSSLRC